MSSVQYLREFISERLTAAAAEIFGVFERTVVHYEEEIDRQRRLLEISYKPEVNDLTAADLPIQNVCQEKEEVSAGQQFSNQQRKSSLDQDKEPEPAQIKVEQEELCTEQQIEQLVLKEETDTFSVTLTYEESDPSEGEREGEQLPDRDQERRNDVNSGSTSNTDLTGRKRPQKIRSNNKNKDNAPLSKSQCDSEAAKISVKCGVCGKVFKNKYHLKMHHRIHTGVKPYACNDCGKSFNDASTLKYHTRTHTGEKPYSCETCGKSFRCSYSVLVHMRTHTGEKPYLCNTCGKRFTNLSAFKWHTAIHTGEKRYSCSICGKSFTQSGNLTAHMGTHTGEKRYSCKICEKSFSRSSNLIVHMRTHTGEKPYPCNTCGERFKYAAALKKHIRTHADEDSFSCETCGRGPTSKDEPSVQRRGEECCSETSAVNIIRVEKVEENH